MITSAGFSFFSVILSCGNLSLRSSGELKEELPYTMGTASEMGLKLIDGFDDESILLFLAVTVLEALAKLLLVLGVLYGKVVFELLVVEVLTVRK